MNYYKIETFSGWLTGCKANSFGEACAKCGVSPYTSRLVAIY